MSLPNDAGIPDTMIRFVQVGIGTAEKLNSTSLPFSPRTQQLPAGTGKIVHCHLPAKLFSVFDYEVPIMEETPVSGAHIVAARTAEITEHVVFDYNRVATFLRETLAQFLRPECRIAVTPAHISVEYKWRRSIVPFGPNLPPRGLAVQCDAHLKRFHFHFACEESVSEEYRSEIYKRNRQW